MTAGRLAKTTSWHRITFSRQEYQSGEMAVLFGAFRAAYVAKNGPEGMAMFGCWNDDGTGYQVYTTPRSVRHIIPLYGLLLNCKPSITKLMFSTKRDCSHIFGLLVEVLRLRTLMKLFARFYHYHVDGFLRA